MFLIQAVSDIMYHDPEEGMVDVGTSYVPLFLMDSEESAKALVEKLNEVKKELAPYKGYVLNPSKSSDSMNWACKVTGMTLNQFHSDVNSFVVKKLDVKSEV